MQTLEKVLELYRLEERFYLFTKQASEAVANLAKTTNQYFVNYRWLGGMLTNWGTISNSIKKLNKINSDLSSENRFTKKELLKIVDVFVKRSWGIMEMKKFQT